jgi:hypothetical protein
MGHVSVEKSRRQQRLKIYAKQGNEGPMASL